MDKQTALDQHRAILLATIDYLLEMAAGRVIADQQDIVGERYRKLQQQAENHYRNGKLKLLQGMMREMDALPMLLQDDSYFTFMQEQTGYDAAMLKQILPDDVPDCKGKGIIMTEVDKMPKKLAEKYSPDYKRTLIVYECRQLSGRIVTEVDIHFGKAGASIYMVEGAGLDINVYWQDNNTVIIETRKDYVAISKHVKQYQCLDDVVKVEYIVH